MCGISGVVNKLGLLGPQHCEAVIDRMNEHLKHRGPDRLGAWHSPEDKVSLGHTRLSIMDLSDVASQPMQDVTGQYVLSYNGELIIIQVLENISKRTTVWCSKPPVIRKYFYTV